VGIYSIITFGKVVMAILEEDYYNILIVEMDERIYGSVSDFL
jgi:hypothetical protein